LALGLVGEAYFLSQMSQTSLSTSPTPSLVCLAVLAAIGAPVSASLGVINALALADDRAGRPLVGLARWAGRAAAVTGALVVGVVATVVWERTTGSSTAADTLAMGIFVVLFLLAVLVLALMTRRRCGQRSAVPALTER
jgi:hypothetical protein